MDEVWLPVVGFEGLYEVSNLGRVKSLERVVTRSNGRPQFWRERILKGGINTNGYWHVNLRNEGTGKTYLISRLVAHAFVANPDNLPEAHHIDENKNNNRADNLEWMTGQKNCEESNARRWVYTDPDGKNHEVFNARVFCNKNNLSDKAMWAVANGYRNSHKGWKARYSNEENTPAEAGV